MLTLVVFVPLVGALAILLLIRNPRTARSFAVAVAITDLALAAMAFYLFDPAKLGMQLVEQFDWIEPLNIQYYLGLDGLNAPLVLLTGILGMCAVLASWNVTVRVREHFVWLLVLQTAVMGVFVAMDFVLFFVFWELELIPLY